MQPVRASDVGGVVAVGGERRPLRLRTTRRTLLSGYASLAGRTSAMKSPVSTGRLGWRPSGSVDAKVGRQVGGARPS
jgi:hypothetical protein